MRKVLFCPVHLATGILRDRLEFIILAPKNFPVIRQALQSIFCIGDLLSKGLSIATPAFQSLTEAADFFFEAFDFGLDNLNLFISIHPIRLLGGKSIIE